MKILLQKIIVMIMVFSFCLNVGAQSKYNPNKIYYLIDFRWKPTDDEHGQGELF